MSSRRIEFTYYPTPSDKGGLIWSPIIPIRISRKSKKTPYFFRALIDSGADVNLFPADHGKAVGIDIRSGLFINTVGIGGEVKAYRHTINLHIGNKVFKTTADFTYDFPLALLGRNGFF